MTSLFWMKQIVRKIAHLMRKSDFSSISRKLDFSSIAKTIISNDSYNVCCSLIVSYVCHRIFVLNFFCIVQTFSPTSLACFLLHAIRGISGSSSFRYPIISIRCFGSLGHRFFFLPRWWAHTHFTNLFASRNFSEIAFLAISQFLCVVFSS